MATTLPAGTRQAAGARSAARAAAALAAATGWAGGGMALAPDRHRAHLLDRDHQLQDPEQLLPAGDDRILRSVNSLFLMGLAIPLQAAIIPVYLIVIRMHMYDTLLAIILPSIAFAIPLSVPVLSNFIRDVQSPGQRTLPLALWTFQGQYSINVPAVLAAVVLTAIPILVLYILGRRQLLNGLTAGFSK